MRLNEVIALDDRWLISSVAVLLIASLCLHGHAHLSENLTEQYQQISFGLSAVLAVISILMPFIGLGPRAIDHIPDASAKDWEYAAEGAMNIALRYRGRMSVLRGKVLRLRKTPRLSRIKSASSGLSDVDGTDDDMDPEDDLEGNLVEANAFVEEVIIPLLSRRFVPPSRIVRLKPKFIEDVGKRIEPHRPEKRREVAGLNRRAGVGLLMTDSAHIMCGCSKKCPTYCFEIKPKWGFLCTEQTEWEVKTRVDRFTMHQHLKKSQEESDHISSYCPLDLFHGGAEGIRRALGQLEKTPQNNLRFFLNGSLVFPTKQNKNSLTKALGGDQLRSDIVSAIVEVLTKENILERILSAQTLGPLNDIESVYPIYLECIRDGLLSVEHAPLRYRSDYMPQVPPKTDEDKLEIVKRFMVACTARDCSIMLTFSECRSEQTPILGRCCGDRWGYVLTVVDLDAKPIHKIQHYYSVDREIAHNYTEKVEDAGGENVN